MQTHASSSATLHGVWVMVGLGFYCGNPGVDPGYSSLNTCDRVSSCLDTTMGFGSFASAINEQSLNGMPT